MTTRRRRGSRRATLAIALACSPAALLVWACLKPTQITLRIDTDLECAALVERGGTAIIGGQASSDPITTTTACEGAGATRSIGTLVVTPSGDRDGLVTLAVVAGVTRPLGECVHNRFEGCVVARRRLRFVPHEPLELPVRISRACVGVPCSDDTTCVEGNCATADVEDPAFCTSGPSCGTPPLTSSAANADAADADAGVVGVGDPELFVPGLQAYGITANATALYWTEDISGSPASTRHLWHRRWAAGPPEKLLENRDGIDGLAATANALAVAGAVLSDASSAGTAYGILADGKLIGPTSFGNGDEPANTVALVPRLAGVTGRVWNQRAALKNDFSMALDTPINPGSYIESDLGGVVYSALRHVVTQSNFVTGNLASDEDGGGLSTPGANDIVGIAVGSRALFLSTTSGDIFSLAWDGNVKRLGLVPVAKDLVVWSRDLFVAGREGIYVFKGVE